MKKQLKYAAFVITYKRVSILEVTVSKLFEQSNPPDYILIVDNDIERSAEKIINPLSSQVGYFNVGYNSGPSGGAYFGLKNLFEKGFEWVLWIDDDDPPSAVNQIEKILNIVNNYSQGGNIGMLGASGVLYNYNACRINRIPDEKLKGILNVDMIAGNQFPIVHKRVYDAGILPNPNLFFGFEDLEFGLRLKKAGFVILVEGEEIARLRKLFNTYGKQKKRGLKKVYNNLWREYYSVRTIIFILKGNKDYFITIKYFFKNIFKPIFALRYGMKYALSLFFYILKGIYDGLTGKMGLNVLPNKKY